MYTFLMQSDAIGTHVSVERFKTLQEAANAAALYMVTAAINGDYVTTQLMNVPRDVPADLDSVAVAI